MTTSLHIISHTHWDREWYQTFQHFRLRLVLLIDNLLDLLENDPSYEYFMLDGQTIVLEDYLLMRPEREAALRAYINSGRILIGPWHILPDMFLVGPEAHIRNLLEGERTCRRFGSRMSVGYMPDSFGHIGQMPQILRGFGIDSACLWRGLDEEPSEVWWQSPDGSQVLLAYLRDSYSNGAFLPAENSQAFASGIAEQAQALFTHSGADQLLIMLGTDHMPPSPNTTANLAHTAAALPDTRVLHSNLPHYLAALQSTLQGAQLPVVKGELRASKRMHLLPGVLSTRMWIKQRNSASENLLTCWAEPFSVFAGLAAPTSAGRLRQPASILRQAWRLLMENHPHDSICGCSIDQVCDEMKVRFDQVDQISDEVNRQSLETLAGEINTWDEARSQLGAIVVFNPGGGERSNEPVSLALSLPPGSGEFEIIDETGQVIPHESVGLGAQELLNASMNAAEFRAAFGMVNDGRVTGLGVRGFNMRRDGHSVHLEVLLAEGNPDQAVWQKALAQAGALLEDPSITKYHVLARGADAQRVLFSAPRVPGLGWRSFSLRPKPAAASAPSQLPALARTILPLVGRIAGSPIGKNLIGRLQNMPQARAPRLLENEFLRVEVEPSGCLSVLDKRSGALYQGLNRFVDGGDCGDEYNYSAPAVNPQTTARLVRVSVQPGSVCQSLSIHLALKTPISLSDDRKSRSRELVEIPIKTVVTLTRGAARIEIHTEIDNRARDHRLRAHFPAPFSVEQAAYDSHFLVLSRPLGVPAYDRQTWIEDPRPEAPQRAFVQICDTRLGLTLANRGLPEVEVLKSAGGTEIALTLLRCVGWLSRDDFQTRRGHAGPAMETPGAQLPGSWSFDYAIIPHPAASSLAARQQAQAFETPLRAVMSPAHSGELPACGSFVKIQASDMRGEADPSQFTLSSVKQAEDGSGWLVRGYNAGDTTLQVRLTPFRPFKSAAQLTLAEEKVGPLEIDMENGSINVTVNPYEIVGVWFEN